MKFLCPSCDRLVPFSSFRTKAGTLWLTCGRCGAESPAEPEAPAAPNAKSTEKAAPSTQATPSAPPPSAAPVEAVPDAPAVDLFAVPADRCPKCIAARTAAAPSCTSCGLVFAQAPAEGFRPDETLAQAWTALSKRWGDWGEHERLLASASIQGELAPLGRLYRLKLATVAKDALAERGRDEVLRLATLASAFGPKTEGPREKPPLWQYVAFGVIGAVLIVLMVVLFKQLQAARM